MIGDAPNGSLAYRIGALERRLDRIDLLEPAVMKKEISDIKEDIHAMARDVAGLRKILIGFIVSFALATASLVVVILTSTTGGP